MTLITPREGDSGRGKEAPRPDSGLLWTEEDQRLADAFARTDSPSRLPPEARARQGLGNKEGLSVLATAPRILARSADPLRKGSVQPKEASGRASLDAPTGGSAVLAISAPDRIEGSRGLETPVLRPGAVRASASVGGEGRAVPTRSSPLTRLDAIRRACRDCKSDTCDQRFLLDLIGETEKEEFSE